MIRRPPRSTLFPTRRSSDLSVYGFTGRITTPDDTYKIIYTAKLSTLSKIDVVQTTTQSDNLTIHIARGSSSQGLFDSYIGTGSAPRSEDTRLNSSHITISYAVFCLKKKKIKHKN